MPSAWSGSHVSPPGEKWVGVPIDKEGKTELDSDLLDERNTELLVTLDGSSQNLEESAYPYLFFT